MAIFAAVPFNLTNGSLADATQVMANFNQIVANGNANAAPLASPAFSGTVTLPDSSTWAGTGIANVVSIGVNTTAPGTGLVNPSVGTVGVTTNSSAAAGQIGEYKSGIVLSGAAAPLGNNNPTTFITLSLTAGDWDVSGEVWFNNVVNCTAFQAAINTSTNAIPTNPADGTSVTVAVSTNAILPVKPCRISLATTTNVFLVAQATFTGSASAFGIIRARRVR